MAGPRLSVTPEAVAWVAERGGEITLRASPRHGCCGGSARLPVAEPGAPREADGWKSEQVEGVTVWLDPELADGEGGLTVRLEGLLRWRRLFVEPSPGA